MSFCLPIKEKIKIKTGTVILSNYCNILKLRSKLLTFKHNRNSSTFILLKILIICLKNR